MFVNLTFSVSRITRTLPYSKIHFGKYNEWQEGLRKLTDIRNKSIGVAAVKRHSYFPGFEKKHWLQANRKQQAQILNPSASVAFHYVAPAPAFKAAPINF